MLASPLHAWREAQVRAGGQPDCRHYLRAFACPWVGQASEVWHTSGDTAEKLPPKELGLVAVGAAAYCYLIASADQARVLDFAHLASMRGKKIIASAGAAEW